MNYSSIRARLTASGKLPEAESENVLTAASKGAKNTPAPVRIGLAISSGGAKGLAHLGVIQVLEENNIPIAAVAGASMGAYVGALWCAGYKGEQLRKLAEEIHSPQKLRDLADIAFPPSKGLFWGQKARDHLRKSIGDITFERLIRPLFVIAADLDTHERIVGRTGRVIDAVHASCAMPGVIVPVHYRGHRCIDGGVIEPVPICTLRDHAYVDYVIAVSTIPSVQEVEACSITATPARPQSFWRRAFLTIVKPVNLLANGNIIDTFNKSLKASQIRMADDSYQHADIVIKPVTCLGNWYDYHEYDHFIQIGREAAEKALPQILNLLNPTTPTTPTTPHEPPPKNLVGKFLNR